MTVPSSSSWVPPPSAAATAAAEARGRPKVSKKVDNVDDVGTGAHGRQNDNDDDLADHDDDDHDEGHVSDGDPPGFIAPPPKGQASALVHRGGHVQVDSSADRVASPAAKNAPAAPATAGRGFPEFDELDKIIFATPAAFEAKAFSIGEACGINLYVIDDRTHKATSAYMHIGCTFRSAGCPFILKLTKAKEGGWVIKSPNATDVEAKLRSVFRCSHPVGSVAGGPNPSAPLPQSQISNSKLKLSTGGEGGSKVVAVKKGKAIEAVAASPLKASAMSKASSSRAVGQVGTTRKTTSHPGPPGTKPQAAKRRSNKPERFRDNEEGELQALPSPPQSLVAPSSSSSSSTVTAAGVPGADQAIVPPFQRSLSLVNQVSPALLPQQQIPAGTSSGAHRHQHHHHAAVPSAVGHGQSPFHPTPPPFPGSLLPPGPHNLSPSYHAPPRRNSEAEWLRYLNALGADDPSLTVLAPVLAHPALDVDPASFFSESTELQVELIQALDVPVWTKLRLREKIRREGKKVWSELNGGRGDGPVVVVDHGASGSGGRAQAALVPEVAQEDVTMQ